MDFKIPIHVSGLLFKLWNKWRQWISMAMDLLQWNLPHYLHEWFEYFIALSNIYILDIWFTIKYLTCVFPLRNDLFNLVYVFNSIKGNILFSERNQSKYEPGYNSHSTTPTKAVIDNPNNSLDILEHYLLPYQWPTIIWVLPCQNIYLSNFNIVKFKITMRYHSATFIVENLELNTQSSLPISGISVITEASTNPTSEDSC